MNLTQLVYVSRCSETLTDAELSEIVARSQLRNAERVVTGVLATCGRHIIQLLEGDKDVVEGLFARISADPRHTEVSLLLQKGVDRRMFPEWGMKHYKPEDANGRLNRDRMAAMVASIQAATNTGRLSVEARVLLNDFRDQLIDQSTVSRRRSNAA